MTITTKHKIGTKTISIKNPARRVEFMAGIEFGMLSKGCKNFGICRIQIINKKEILISNNKFHNIEAMALIHIGPKGKVEIFFLHKGMDKKIQQLYFSKKNFIIGEDVIINAPALCPKERSRKGFINKGAYPLEERPWGYWVKF